MILKLRCNQHWIDIRSCRLCISGILDHYYDACFGYIDTHERRNAFNFTVPIHPPSDIAVIIDEGKFEGDEHDLTGKTQGIYTIALTLGVKC